MKNTHPSGPNHPLLVGFSLLGLGIGLGSAVGCRTSTDVDEASYVESAVGSGTGSGSGAMSCSGCCSASAVESSLATRSRLSVAGTNIPAGCKVWDHESTPFDDRWRDPEEGEHAIVFEFRGGLSGSLCNITEPLVNAVPCGMGDDVQKVRSDCCYKDDMRKEEELRCVMERVHQYSDGLPANSCKGIAACMNVIAHSCSLSPNIEVGASRIHKCGHAWVEFEGDYDEDGEDELIIIDAGSGAHGRMFRCPVGT